MIVCRRLLLAQWATATPKCCSLVLTTLEEERSGKYSDLTAAIAHLNAELLSPQRPLNKVRCVISRRVLIVLLPAAAPVLRNLRETVS
ncbi:hypothetical protein C8Q80DRAFT_1187014 [Daedaleopsis nitida]|nr:hypothetical protein C8Q80DRAFT_1187014 [Daedaleopsis nitida]